MATDRRKSLLLVALFAVLAAVAYWQLVMTSPAAAPSSNQSRPAAAPTRTGRNGGAGAITAPEVHLDALNAEQPKPADAGRNLFRFKPKAPPPPPQSQRPTPTPDSGPPPPPPPVPVPSIALKFIGTINSQGKTLAILSDGQGPPFYAQEGGTIAGRYRILRIGVESVEIAYLDGRGRQTIRVGGQ